jgi:hypothetical protein
MCWRDTPVWLRDEPIREGRHGIQVTETRPLGTYAEVALGRQRSPQHDAEPLMVPTCVQPMSKTERST